MMSITHAAIALTTTSISLGTADAFVLGLSIIGSQLPDLDKSDSIIGRVLFPIARWLEKRYPHRTITHSFISTGILAIASLPLWFLHWQYWAALVLGQFMGWFADCFTKMGVCAFYPNPARLVIPGNPRARIRSGSTVEYWIIGIASFMAIASINLASAGGITEQFAKSFFPDTATAATLFQRYGSERVVIVEVLGLHVHTSQSISGRFTIIEATANDLLGQAEISQKLYKIGISPDVQIRPNRVRSQLGDRLTITAQEVALQDISVADFINRIPQNAYISGSLLLDDIEDVQIPVEIESYPVIRVFGGQIELSNARPQQIASVIGDFWILTGKTIIKERKL
jgi:inner membrane protein